MEKIKFNKEELVNLGFCLQREFLLTSGSGAFATSTLSLCNTRKYHGLLIARQPKIDNEWHVLLSSLDETIVERESEFHLALHHYQNDTYYPKGHKYLESFEQNKTVKLTYKVLPLPRGSLFDVLDAVRQIVVLTLILCGYFIQRYFQFV